MSWHRLKLLKFNEERRLRMQLHQLHEFLEWRALNATIEQPAFFFYPHVTRLFVVKEIGTLSFEIRED